MTTHSAHIGDAHQLARHASINFDKHLGRPRVFVDIDAKGLKSARNDRYHIPSDNYGEPAFDPKDAANDTLLSHLRGYNFKPEEPPRSPSPQRDRNGFRQGSVFYEPDSPPSSANSSPPQTPTSIRSKNSIFSESWGTSIPHTKTKSKNSIFDQSWAVTAPNAPSVKKSKNDIFGNPDNEPVMPPPSVKLSLAEDGVPNTEKTAQQGTKEGGEQTPGSLKVPPPKRKMALLEPKAYRELKAMPSTSMRRTLRPGPLPDIGGPYFTSPTGDHKPSPNSMSSPFLLSPTIPGSPMRYFPPTSPGSAAPPLPPPHDINLMLLPTRKNLLGFGRHAQVYKAKYTTPTLPIPQTCAAKRLNPNPESQTLGLSEAFILRRLACSGGQHRNIIALLGVKDEADTCAPGVLHRITTSSVPPPYSTSAPSATPSPTLGPVTMPSAAPSSPSSLSASSTTSAWSNDDATPRLVLLLDYCANGSLWDWVQAHRRKIGRRLWMKWARQLASAMERVHAVGLVHHDVKPHNILLTEALDVKLSDFGTAIFVNPDHPLKDGLGRGTPPYSAPEMVATPARTYSFPADVYSLGVTLYVVGLTGEEPFRNMRNPVEVMLWVRKGGFREWEERLRLHEHESSHDHPSPGDRRPRFLNGDPLPAGVSALLKDMLKKDPEERPDIREVVKRLRAMDIRWEEDGSEDVQDDGSGYLGLAGGEGFDVGAGDRGCTPLFGDVSEGESDAEVVVIMR